MRYTLLMHYPEMTEGELGPEAIAESQLAFDAYGKALDTAGALVTAEVFSPSATSRTVTLAGGGPSVAEAAFSDAPVALGGIFVIEVADAETALGWAEQCPALPWGAIELRASAVSFRGGAWQ